MNAAELRGVSYVYSKNTPFCKVAVNNIDISFEEKIVTGIIGQIHRFADVKRSFEAVRGRGTRRG